MSKFGKAKYGGNKRNYFKIKDGDNVFTILPPMNIKDGKLGDKGIWSQFYKIHYGYKNSEGKLRPFQSSLVKNRSSKMIEVPDAALERIEKLKAMLEAAKKSGDTKTVAKLNEFVGQKGQFNLDSNHYVNAIDTQGNVGILKLRHRAKVALDATIKRLRDGGVDPLDPETLRTFVITRTGTGLDTAFQANVLTKKINIQGVGEVSQEVVTKIDDVTATRLFSEAADLSTLFKAPTAAEIARIVVEGATAVDEILDGKGTSTDSSGEDYDDSGEEDSTPTGQAGAAAAAPQATTGYVQTPPATQPTTTGTSLAPANTTVVTTAVAQTTPAPVASAPAAAPVQASAPVTPASTAGTTAAQVTEMSDQDFLASLNL